MTNVRINMEARPYVNFAIVDISRLIIYILYKQTPQ